MSGRCLNGVCPHSGFELLRLEESCEKCLSTFPTTVVLRRGIPGCFRRTQSVAGDALCTIGEACHSRCHFSPRGDISERSCRYAFSVCVRQTAAGIRRKSRSSARWREFPISNTQRRRLVSARKRCPQDYERS